MKIGPLYSSEVSYRPGMGVDVGEEQPTLNTLTLRNLFKPFKSAYRKGLNNVLKGTNIENLRQWRVRVGKTCPDIAAQKRIDCGCIVYRPTDTSLRSAKGYAVQDNVYLPNIRLRTRLRTEPK